MTPLDSGFNSVRALAALTAGVFSIVVLWFFVDLAVVGELDGVLGFYV